PEEHVDLGPHPEPVREVDPRLDGESDARHEPPIIAGLEIVEVRTRPVQVAVDRVAGAMHEVVRVSGFPNDRASRIVQVGAGHPSPIPLPPSPFLSQPPHRGAARPAPPLPHPPDLRLWRAAPRPPPP